jgi:hypothetical protein
MQYTVPLLIFSESFLDIDSACTLSLKCFCQKWWMELTLWSESIDRVCKNDQGWKIWHNCLSVFYFQSTKLLNFSPESFFFRDKVTFNGMLQNIQVWTLCHFFFHYELYINISINNHNYMFWTFFSPTRGRTCDKRHPPPSKTVKPNALAH